MDGKTHLNTAEWWVGNRGPFTVPVEGPDDCCEFWAVQRLCNANGHPPSAADDDPTKH